MADFAWGFRCGFGGEFGGEFGGNLVGIWWEFGGNLVGIWWEFGGNSVGIWWRIWWRIWCGIFGFSVRIWTPSGLCFRPSFSYRRCSLPNFRADWPVPGARSLARTGASAWLRGRAAVFCVAQRGGVTAVFSIFVTLPVRRRSRACCWPELGASGQNSNCGPRVVSVCFRSPGCLWRSWLPKGVGFSGHSVCARRFVRFCNSLRAAVPGVRFRRERCCRAVCVQAAAPLARCTVRCKFFVVFLFPISLRFFLQFFLFGGAVPQSAAAWFRSHAAKVFGAPGCWLLRALFHFFCKNIFFLQKKFAIPLPNFF